MLLACNFIYIEKCDMNVIFLPVIVISVFISLFAGKYMSLILPDMHPLFDHKPFNCRPCLSFHLCWVLFTLYSVITASVLCFYTGVAIAFLLFFILKFIDNKHIEE